MGSLKEREFSLGMAGALLREIGGRDSQTERAGWFFEMMGLLKEARFTLGVLLTEFAMGTANALIEMEGSFSMANGSKARCWLATLISRQKTGAAGL
jgi:hypothetical protein